MTEELLQNYIVYAQGTTYHVRGQLSADISYLSTRADEVIQHAVDLLAGAGGGEVILQRGIFPLTRPICLASNVWLHGSGRGTKLVVADDRSTGIGLLGEGLKGITISDISVQAQASKSSVAGIVLDDCGDCQVRDVLCQGFGEYGLWLRNNSFLCELKSCKAADNGKANIYLDGLAYGGRGGDFVPNLVNSCITYRGGVGIECNRTLVLNIVGCAVFQPDTNAYYIHDHSNSVLVSGCRSFQTEKHAIVVETSHEVNISSNIFCWQRGHGVVLEGVSWGTITGNEIIDSGVRARDGSKMIGIVLRKGTQGIQVTGNAIFNWGDQVPMQYGIQEDESCRNNSITGNNTNYFTETDVVSQGFGTKASGNIGVQDQAYENMGRVAPDYTTERIDVFLQA